METQTSNGKAKGKRAKAAPKAPPARKEKRQTEIAGAERKGDKQLDEIVTQMLEHKERRLSSLHAEQEKHGEALARMRSLKLHFYRYWDGDVPFILERNEGSETLSIRRDKKGGEAQNN